MRHLDSGFYLSIVIRSSFGYAEPFSPLFYPALPPVLAVDGTYDLDTGRDPLMEEVESNPIGGSFAVYCRQYLDELCHSLVYLSGRSPSLGSKFKGMTSFHDQRLLISI